MSGPLQGIRVIELAGMGPGPFAAMLLADMGADVIRVERPAPASDSGPPLLTMRGRRSLGLDLKRPGAVDAVLRLVDSADVLVEGFRPGVAERLGLGPTRCLERNPALVYGRVTGWGQDGPLANSAGHDINFIAVAGVLAHIGRKDAPPTPPLNLVGDYAAGAMFLLAGVLAALVHRGQSGRGQVVDTAMVDGAALLMAGLWSTRETPMWDEDRRGTNLLDSGAPFYEVYETADRRWIAVGAVERAPFSALLDTLGIDPEEFPDHHDRRCWPALRVWLDTAFKARTVADWQERFSHVDACVTPVLTMGESMKHPQIQARRTIMNHDGRHQPAPAPRFSQTPSTIRSCPSRPGEHTVEILSELGFDVAEIGALLNVGVAS